MTLPFLNRAVEAKEVSHPFLVGEKLFSTRAIKIDEKGSIPRNQNIFELEVSVKEPGLVKFAKKAASGTDGSPLKKKFFSRGLKSDPLTILNQIYGLRNFQGEKIGLIKGREDKSVDGTNRLDRWDPTRKNLLC
jgi:hypothetical protein